MAKIIGLEEQKKALSEINSLIKKIEMVNIFLENIDQMIDDFTISYRISSVNQAESNSDFPESAEIDSINHKKTKFYTTVGADNIHTIKTFVLETKRAYVDKVNELTTAYSISLDNSERFIMERFIIEKIDDSQQETTTWERRQQELYNN